MEQSETNEKTGKHASTNRPTITVIVSVMGRVRLRVWIMVRVRVMKVSTSVTLNKRGEWNKAKQTGKTGKARQDAQNKIIFCYALISERRDSVPDNVLDLRKIDGNSVSLVLTRLVAVAVCARQSILHNDRKSSFPETLITKRLSQRL